MSKRSRRLLAKVAKLRLAFSVNDFFRSICFGFDLNEADHPITASESKPKHGASQVRSFDEAQHNKA